MVFNSFTHTANMSIGAHLQPSSPADIVHENQKKENWDLQSLHGRVNSAEGAYDWSLWWVQGSGGLRRLVSLCLQQRPLAKEPDHDPLSGIVGELGFHCAMSWPELFLEDKDVGTPDVGGYG